MPAVIQFNVSGYYLVARAHLRTTAFIRATYPNDDLDNSIQRHYLGSERC
jgi:hypothetical protein